MTSRRHIDIGAEPIIRACHIAQGRVLSEDDVWDMAGIFWKEFGVPLADFGRIPIPVVIKQMGRIAKRKKRQKKELEETAKKRKRQSHG